MGFIRPDEQVLGQGHDSYQHDEQKREHKQGHNEASLHSNALPKAGWLTRCPETGWLKHGQSYPAQWFPDSLLIDAFEHYNLLRMYRNYSQGHSIPQTPLTSCFASTTSCCLSPLSG
jgi:hypothetical protein